MLVAVVLFALVTAAVAARWSVVVDLDARLARHLDVLTHRHPAWHRFWLDVSDVVQPTVLRLLAAATVAVLLVRRRSDVALRLAVVMIGAAVLSSVVKGAVDRPRPVPEFRLAVAGGASYPSGHALTAAAAAIAFVDVAIATTALSRRATQVLAGSAAGLVVLVSLSRLFLAVHFLSDVVGGVLAGSVWAAVVTLIASRRPVLGPSSGLHRLAFRRDIR